jgi:hypothetical protein
VERRRPPPDAGPAPYPSELDEAMDTRSMKLMRRDMTLIEKAGDGWKVKQLEH